MKITRNNYEEYFLDYLEGELEETLVDDFIDFLRQNPDLKAELEMVAPIKVEMENISFKGKEKLYKEKYDLKAEFDHAAVARMEGDLSEKDEKEFRNYLAKHPEKQKEASLFEKTKLKADQSIIFSKKKRLYHRSGGKTILLWATRIAAVLILAFIAYHATDFISTENIIPENQIAVSQNETNTGQEKPVAQKETEKEKPEEQDKNKTTEPVKKAKTKTEPVKSLRENTKGRMEHEKIAEARMPVEIPEKLSGLNASLTVLQPNVGLAQTKTVINEAPAKFDDERLLAETIREKTGIGNLSLNKVAKAGLTLVSNVSNEKFSYQTNSRGEITELNYDSRLLAFSIPTKN
ncbi:hypothetical protein SAMN05444274_10943 [Mariniphaga anaerophila]|uniref:Uncharacterized protein n=1 Tax=Mariniphaga anaerophila TaxID=1484053 RepID=A0A1M5EHT9_9BACT|nr:hypothetical protein [Mariniphaga anaerophila]SHF78809.1 hypothetical protein SAMN05444274_10943 [Mariniphaga anaerophila]